jgi:hypothetical protein
VSAWADRIRALCERHNAPYVPTALDDIAGVARKVGSGVQLVNGLRHRCGETSGWFIWAGDELSSDPDFVWPFTFVTLLIGVPRR